MFSHIVHAQSHHYNGQFFEYGLNNIFELN